MTSRRWHTSLLTFAFIVQAGFVPALAADNDVQVDLGTLENYSPPPMFGAAPAIKPPAAAKPEKKKPVEDISEKNIVQPTAAEILKQIEDMEAGRTSKPAKAKPKAKVAAKPVEENKPVRIRADNAQEKEEPAEAQVITQAPISVSSGVYEMSIPLLPGSTESQDAQDAALNEILPRLRAAENARLEIHSFATVKDNANGEAHRLSLKRALALKSFLVTNGIGERRINVLPLGAKTEILPKNRMDFVIRYL